MNNPIHSRELPLCGRTPDSWAEAVLDQPLALLSDHAYLEKKAASNALDLLNLWPEPAYSKGWVITLSAIARDEVSHLHAVVRLLDQRGGKLERLHRNPYAHELRKLVRRGRGSREVLDRLLVAALIEARSCERFEVLSRCCPDLELAEFYRGLWSSEYEHYAVFLRLAEDIMPAKEVNARWAEMVQAEAGIINLQPQGPRIHSGAATNFGGSAQL